jgi:hypothetical protein
VSLPAAGFIVAAWVAVSVLAMLITRRLITGDTLLADQERGSAFYGFVGTAFAVVLAFVILVAFQTYDSGKEAAGKEALAVVELARTAQFYPVAQRERLQGQLACYARAVTYDEWPLLAHSKRSAIVDRSDASLGSTYGDLAARTEQQRAGIGHILDLTEERREGRRQRLWVADPFVPGPVLAMLVIGGVVTTFFGLLLVDLREAAAVQAALIGSVAILVVSGFLLVLFLDHPYGNAAVGIKPTEMKRSLTILDESYPARTPCDARGRVAGRRSEKSN